MPTSFSKEGLDAKSVPISEAEYEAQQSLPICLYTIRDLANLSAASVGCWREVLNLQWNRRVHCDHAPGCYFVAQEFDNRKFSIDSRND